MDPAWVGAALVGQLRRGRADVPAPAAPAVQGPSGPSPGPGGRRSRGRARGLALHPGPNATGWCPTGRSRTPYGASPMAWTFIRATSFLQNRSTTHAPEVRERDELWVPAGKGRTAFVDARDVAARRPHRPQPRGHGLHPDRPGRAHRRRTAAHWPLARDFGSFTRDHASPGRQPPWPLPERLASSTRPIGKEAACGSAVPGVACPRTGPEVAFKQGHSTLPPTRASPDNEPGIG